MSSDAASAPSRDPAAPRSRRSPRRRPRARLPFTIRYVLPIVAVVVFGMWLRDTWRGSRVELMLLDGSGKPVAVAGATLQLFDLVRDPSAASPHAPRGEPVPIDSEQMVWSADEIGEVALVRFSAPDFGVTFADVKPGQVTKLYVGPPEPVKVRLSAEDDGSPVAGADVLVLGGGSRGVPLARATSGEDGTLVVTEIADGVPSWCLRVLADGFEILNHLWYPSLQENPGAPVELKLKRTAPVRGALVAAAGANYDPAGQVLRGFHLPGLTTEADSEGRFVIDHLPAAPRRAHLIVPLPDGLTYRRTTVTGGDRDVEVRVQPATTVRGRVVNGHNKNGVPGAKVFHLHGPRGVEQVETASDGSFELGRVPSGPVQIEALLRVRWTNLPEDEREGAAEEPNKVFKTVTGTASLVVVPGQPVEDVEILVW